MTPPATDPTTGAGARRFGWVILALALGGFGIGTTEFVAMGLLPDIASSLSISEPTAGHLISAYALGVVIGAPLITAIAAKVSRRRLLIWLMVAFTAGNALSVVAPTYPALLAARFIAGLPHGAYFGVAALVAAHLAAPGKRARSVGYVMLGLSVANVLGVPAATWIGQALGWRSALALVVVIGAITVAALVWVVPDLSAMPIGDMRSELGALRNGQVLLTLAVGMIGFGGLFAFYSYLNTALTSVGGVSESIVPVALMLFGCGMVAGNIVGGRLADRSVDLGVVAGLASVGVALAAFSLLLGIGWLAVLFAFVIGATGSIAIPALQTRLMDVAHDGQTVAAAMNHSALNVANALGAWLGGLVLAHGLGYRAPAAVGAGLALAGLVVFAVAVVRGRGSGADRRTHHEESVELA
ncbi:MFS transporter [Gordonia sp. PP30]|uniref:MFS transporter n=1 Tax=Gordonia sp. PP30 TaxID=2935861 RepID=UPI001FFF7BA7|nr:MFS transporter [Gordonia sp. PP30]UQE76969.1 MFS transporter [Gordonia sp. PP30]